MPLYMLMSKKVLIQTEGEFIFHRGKKQKIQPGAVDRGCPRYRRTPLFPDVILHNVLKNCFNGILGQFSLQ